MVTIIADNYYGYCKKEVKTQISYAANLFGLCEEEHAGGAIAFPAYVLGQEFYAGPHRLTQAGHVRRRHAPAGRPRRTQARGLRGGPRYPEVFYVPGECRVSACAKAACSWPLKTAATHELTLRAGEVYVLPWGTKIRLRKTAGGAAWRLVGVARRRHSLPQTLHRLGRRQIAKFRNPSRSIMLKGPCSSATTIATWTRWRRFWTGISPASISKPAPDSRAQRPILSPERSLGSVIKLLTPSPEYTDEHNEWLRELPQTIRQLVFTVKRYYRPEWGDNWREHFTVDRINGLLGHELKYDDQKLVGNYLRVGYDPDGSWRILQAAPGLPSRRQGAGGGRHHRVGRVAARGSLNDLDPEYPNPQRQTGGRTARACCSSAPTMRSIAASIQQAEADIASPGTFLSNFEPLTVGSRRAGMVDHVVEFDRYTEPMKQLIAEFRRTSGKPAYVVSSAHPRMVDGNPSKNPRYLQKRPDLVNPREALSRRDRHAPGPRDSAGRPCAFPGQRGTAGPPQQSARTQARHSAAGRLQSDSLSGTARTVHGFHLQPDRQVAFDYRVRQRRRAHQGAVQRAAGRWST